MQIRLWESWISSLLREQCTLLVSGDQRKADSFPHGWAQCPPKGRYNLDCSINAWHFLFSSLFIQWSIRERTEFDMLLFSLWKNKTLDSCQIEIPSTHNQFTIGLKLEIQWKKVQVGWGDLIQIRPEGGEQWADTAKFYAVSVLLGLC